MRSDHRNGRRLRCIRSAHRSGRRLHCIRSVHRSGLRLHCIRSVHRNGLRSRCMRTGHPTASRPRLLKHTSPCAGRQDDRKELPKDPPRILPASGCCFFRCPEEALQAHLKAYILPMRPDHRRRMPSVRQPGQNDPCFSGDTPTAGGQSRVLNRRCAEYSTAAPHRRLRSGRYTPDRDTDPGRSSEARASLKRYPG